MNQQEDSFYLNDDEQPAEEFDSRHLREPPSSSMSTGSKILIIVGGVVGVLLLLCCGGVVWIASKFEKPRATSNPTEVQEITRSILEFDVPERFKPAQAITMNLVMVKMDTTRYEASDGESTLMLMRMDMPVEPAQMKEARHSMQMQAGSQSHLENFKSESRTYTVNGTEIEVVYTHGTLSQSNSAPDDHAGKKWFSAQAVLTSGNNLVMITITGPEEEFDLEEIETMIQSIKAPE